MSLKDIHSGNVLTDGNSRYLVLSYSSRNEGFRMISEQSSKISILDNENIHQYQKITKL